MDNLEITEAKDKSYFIYNNSRYENFDSAEKQYNFDIKQEKTRKNKKKQAFEKEFTIKKIPWLEVGCECWEFKGERYYTYDELMQAREEAIAARKLAETFIIEKTMSINDTRITEEECYKNLKGELSDHIIDDKTVTGKIEVDFNNLMQLLRLLKTKETN